MASILWKKLFIAAAVLLVISLALSVSSLYRSQQLDNRLNQQERMLQNYTDIREQISLRLGTGTDAPLFITPEAPEVAALVKEITTGGFNVERFWKDYIEFYRWILINVEYTQDSPLPILPETLASGPEALHWENDFWRLPMETIASRQGDCEDMAVLLTSLLLNYNQHRFPVWVIGARTYQPVPKAHIAVAIPLENANLAIFDIAGRYYTPFPTLGGFGSQPFPQALSHWFTNLGRAGMLNPEIYVAFSEDFYREFTGTEEFLSWVQDYYLKATGSYSVTSPPSSSSESQ